jgi:4-hydroxythreonine-4-phosphate dehydrogenase
VTGRAVRLAVTMGDPAGIGPEVAAGALRELPPAERAALEVHLVGDPEAFARAGLDPAAFPTHATSRYDAARHGVGRPSAASGEAAGAALLAAIDLAMRGTVDGVVTAPLSKQALQLAGHGWPGQTEALIERSGARRGVMLFVGGGLKVAIATRHVALRDVPALLDPVSVRDDLLQMHEGLERDFGVARPRIGVCGLNPHAGEAGRFGDEEARVLAPALAAARAAGAAPSEPLPADTVFVRHRKGEFDAVLALYHDQGLIPVKLLSFGGGVNVTLGLPFVRTSPDHGTAYDIAGQGRADPSSMIEAVRWAAVLIRNRRGASP